MTRDEHGALQAQSYDEYFRGSIDPTGPMGKKDAYRLSMAQQVGTRLFSIGSSDYTLDQRAAQ